MPAGLQAGALVLAAMGFAAACGAEPPVRYVVTVPVSNAADVRALEGQGYGISHVHPGEAELLVSVHELGALREAGYTVDIVERQPNPPEFSKAKGLGVYHSYSGMTSELQQVAADHPAIVRLTSLGASVQGRELWALHITDNPGIEEAEPEFKYVSTMHGDEPVGTELCLYLIERLTDDYGNDARITSLVDSTSIWIVPLMNPDGLELGSRANASGRDLNRDFPIYPNDFFGTRFDGTPLWAGGREPETQRVMEWSAANSFVLSANLHTGAVVVNYPYDYEEDVSSGSDAPTPDDVLFEELSLTYAQPNTPMFTSSIFPNGITNGSAWFSITGGMQDWNYRYLGAMEVTLELAVPKKPPESQLSTYWSDNEESMLRYMESVHRGIHGLVREAHTLQPIAASIAVEGNPQRVYTDPDVGDFYRLLLPGTYTITVNAPGYGTKTLEQVTVTEGEPTFVDVRFATGAELPVSRAAAVVTAIVLGGAGCWTAYRCRHKAAVGSA